MSRNNTQRGIVLIICLIFLCIFAALAVSTASMCDNNVQIADNHRKADAARACAESGLDVIRFWLYRISIPETPLDQRLDKITISLQTVLATFGVANIAPVCNGSVITIPSVTLNLAKQQSFSAVITLPVSDKLQIAVTGVYGPAVKAIRANYLLIKGAHSAFDYGVATKGPLSMTGNVGIEGANLAVESNVYIESAESLLALSMIGHSQIAGDVFIVNPLADVTLQGGNVEVGGETGQNALNHIFKDVPATDFPIPNPGYFEHYVTNVINLENTTFENAVIPANTNPSFTGNITIRGVLYVETPNVVTFAGNTTVTGIIAGNGNWNDDSQTNQIKFTGNVFSNSVTTLPNEPQFSQLRNETGTFLIAPGFGVSFGGNFHTLNGAIAGNGIEFYGNAGGTINGSIINYSEEQMSLTGNSDLVFNRSGITSLPAGFVPELRIKYDPSSYSEGPF
jgi:hypothetical protein